MVKERGGRAPSIYEVKGVMEETGGLSYCLHQPFVFRFASSQWFPLFCLCSIRFRWVSHCYVCFPFVPVRPSLRFLSSLLVPFHSPWFSSHLFRSVLFCSVPSNLPGYYSSQTQINAIEKQLVDTSHHILQFLSHLSSSGRQEDHQIEKKKQEKQGKFLE